MSRIVNPFGAYLNNGGQSVDELLKIDNDVVKSFDDSKTDVVSNPSRYSALNFLFFDISNFFSLFCPQLILVRFLYFEIS